MVRKKFLGEVNEKADLEGQENIQAAHLSETIQDKGNRGQSVNAGTFYRRYIKGCASPVRNPSGALFLTGLIEIRISPSND